MGSEAMYLLLLRHLMHPEHLSPRQSICRAVSLLPLVTPSSLYMGEGKGSRIAVMLFGSCLGDQRVWETERSIRIF